MKFETLLLRGLFIATLLACCMTVVGMARPTTHTRQFALAAPATAVVSANQVACALPADGVLCPLKPVG
ncbi:hypothetical protein [Dyella sp. A6]|uniref:hypothetical protein n=1 Tax=Dyella aluminiiresistens TaxID=3069105 RepID=UPI002E7A61A5|nr:hypothetical protein [Dyella sp. A6]